MCCIRRDFIMVNSPAQSMVEDKNIMYSGMFLRPHIAESLRVLICNKAVQQRAQFTVAKSQVHPNGLCEIVVKKQDPNVSTSSIMELLKQCRDLVRGQGVEARMGKEDLDRTIDLTNDDSICIVSPTASNGRTVTGESKVNSPFCLQSLDPSRKVSFKRNISNSTLQTGSQCVSFEPEPKRPNIVVQVSNDLRTSLATKDNDAKQLSNPNSFKDALTSNLHSSFAPKSHNEQSSDPKFFEDALPSAPEWISAESSKFPLFNINKHLGAKNVHQDHPPSTSSSTQNSNHAPSTSSSTQNSNHAPSTSSSTQNSNHGKQFFEDALPSAPLWIGAKSSKFPLFNINKHLGAKNVHQDLPPSTSSSTQNSNHDEVKDQLPIPKFCNESKNKSSENDMAFGSSVSAVSLERSLDQSVEILDESVKVSSTEINDNSCSRSGNVKKDEKLEVENISSIPHQSRGKGDSSVGVPEVDQFKNVSPCIGSHVDSSPHSRGQCINSCQEKAEVDPATSSLDDEIIIEKEVLSDPMASPHTFIIDDSDDEIAVCEVVRPSSSSNDSQLKRNLRLKLSKQKKKKMKHAVGKPVKIPAGTNFTASTTSGSAPDFIPLNPHFRRIDPKTSNTPGNTEKKAKQLKLHEKKIKKAKAQLHEERRRDTTSSQSGSTTQEIPSKEKYEFNGNVMNPNSGEPKTGLRPIVIDASNVAVGHGRGTFSVAGLKICIKYFTDRGHKVYAFAPKFRRFRVSPEDRKVMDDLEAEGVLSYTPSRTMADGRKVASYDDRFIVQTAAELGGVVVSTDNFRDLLSENEQWRETIEQRLLMFTWAKDILLFPNDPLGRNGPHLTEFLRFPDPPSKS